MASEYFSTLQYIWLNIVFFVFSLFLFAVCLYACLFVRWVYKRRLRQKTEEMIDAYKGEENKRKEIEINLKRQELEFPEKKKKSSKKRNIHIVTKPCNHVIQKNSRELIVRQVNENPNDEVSCEPPHQQAPPPQIQQQHQQQQQGPQVVPPQHIVHHLDHGQLQQQYVLVPVEMLKNQGRVKTRRSSPAPPQKLIVESVATQTSDRSEDVSELEKKTSEDWLSGYDEKDGERIDVDEELEEQESEKYMRRRQEAEDRKYRKKRNIPEVASDEVRVSIESDAPPSPPKDISDSAVTSSSGTSSGTPSTDAKSSNSTPESGVTSTAPDSGNKEDPKKSGSPKKNPSPPKTGSAPSAPTDPNGSAPSADSKNPKDSKDPKDPKDSKNSEDKSYVASQYFGQPGENTSGLSSTPAKPSSSPAARPSFFPYFVDPKAKEPSVSTSKASSKLTEPENDLTDSSCALYRNKKKKMPSDSAKVYNGAGTPKSKTPK